ncbi:hypothetical protein X797_008537 [Metarhizium robertsii]|uniref:Uncharacterized protein n=2 Tax=Metarhizium robertsii TaxID=568076 RepID=E9F824_METRA|nr:uncharacterized protein MAA_08423 [Metarhizium robertsii ARSEF 23]EFY96116.1 hypothetical protein MAA_08423 [Metarhizium robertsii ARSEF 23]EXU98360.1 hypothetical protein X797_008537 [Metarhizium robertsii]
MYQSYVYKRSLPSGLDVTLAVSSPVPPANETNTLSYGERAAGATLAVLAFSIMCIAYWTLAKVTGYLLCTAKYPSAALAANIGTILEAAWPESTRAADDLACERKRNLRNAIRLIYLGDVTDEQHPHRIGRGMSQCEATKPDGVSECFLWIAGGCPIMKVVIQIAIWEWVSIWLMVLTLLVTLIHNSFFSHGEGPDSKPRLFVVCIYAGCFAIHACLVLFLCLGILTQACASQAWSLLNRCHFAVVDRHQLVEHIRDERNPLEFGQIEKSGIASTSLSEPGSYLAALEGRDPAPRTTRSEAEKERLDMAHRDVAHNQEKFRDDMGTCADKALDLVLLNIVTALNICVTQAFSAWTKRPLIDNASTQIGSIALATAVLLGMASMFRSALQLSTVKQTYGLLLGLKEIKTNLQVLEYADGRPFRGSIVGFFHGYLEAHPITLASLLPTSSWVAMLQALLFGPMFSLLPNADERTRRSNGTNGKLCVQAMGQDVVFTTYGTNRQSIDSQAFQNVNSINVCCSFDRARFDEVFKESSEPDPTESPEMSGKQNTGPVSIPSSSTSTPRSSGIELRKLYRSTCSERP